MRILIATGIYPPSIGGPATYSRLLNEELPRYGVETDVLTFDKVRHLPPVVRHILFFFKVLFKGKGSDIVYAQDLVSVGFPAACANVFLRRVFIVKMVGDHVWEQGVQRFGITQSLDEFSDSTDTPCLYLRFLKAVRNWVACRARCIVVPSEYLKTIVVKWGVAEEKIKVINNSFEEIEMPKENSAEIRSRLGFNGTIVTSVGRLVPWKGFDVLIDAVAEISKDVRDIKLLIIGDGPIKSRLQRKIDEEKLSDIVALAGKMPQRDLFMYIKASDVFALNTAYEGFSHQLLEVMALGVPIVTTLVGGNPELIKSGINGLLVEYNDVTALKKALLTMIKMKDKSEQFVSAARVTLEEFMKDAMLAKLIKEFRILCPKSF